MTPESFKIRYRPYLGLPEGASGPRFMGPSKATLGMSDQEAARYYLSEFFRQDERNEIRALAGATRNNRTPSLRYTGVQEQPKLRTRIVKFVETKDSIPIFGSNIIVELGANQELFSITGELTRVDGVDSVATLSGEAALDSLKEFTESRDWKADEPERNFYLDGENKWHLVYLFHDVPAAPHEEESTTSKPAWSYGRRFDYFVDAHDGSVVDYYSAHSVKSEAAVRI